MRLRPGRYDEPEVVAMTAEVQAEYGRIYGGDGDASAIEAGEFVAPRGHFVVLEVAGAVVAMGGWRRGGPAGESDAEIKRMYVRPAYRGRGWSRVVLDEIERTAAANGVRRLVLATGVRQPVAVGLYRAAGYEDVEPFGHYRYHEGGVHLAKVLAPGA